MRRVVLVLVCALALTACHVDVSQDDDVDPDLATVRSGLAELYVGAGHAEGTEAEGACFARALTDRLTLTQLVDAGVVRDDGRVASAAPMLDVEVAGAWVDAAQSCAPYVDVSTRAAVAADRRVDAAAYRTCLTGTVPPDVVRSALVATLNGRYGSDPAVGRLRVAEETCRASAVPARD